MSSNSGGPPFLLPPPMPPPPAAHMQPPSIVPHPGVIGGPPPVSSPGQPPPSGAILVQIKSEPSDLEFKPEVNLNAEHENQLIAANGANNSSSHEEIINSDFGQVARETAPSGRTVLGITYYVVDCLYVIEF